MSTPRKIKVMLLAASLGQGGAERVLSLLARHLDRSIFAPEVTIFTRVIAYELPEDVQLHVLDERPTPAIANQWTLPPDLEAANADTVTWINGAASKVAAIVREREPDVIVSSPLWASLMVAAAAEGFPESTHLINRVDAPPSVSMTNESFRELFAYIVESRFPSADAVVAVSGGVADDLAANFGVDRDHATVIHNPADLVRIQQAVLEPVNDPEYADGTPVVLFVGRHERVKGIEYLLRAVALVSAQRRIRCVLVGDGEHRKFLQALVKHLGLEDRVHFFGRRENPFKLMANASMLILPSLSEGMSNVLVEALACGCPVIATDIEGGITREILGDDDYGLVVPRQDHEAIASAIVRLLDDAELRTRLAEAGPRRARDFDLPSIMDRYQDVILKAARSEASAVTRLGSRRVESAVSSSVASGGNASEVPRRIRVLMLTSSMRHGGATRFVSTMLDNLDRTRFAPELAVISDTAPDCSIPTDVAVHRIVAERVEGSICVLPVPADVAADLPADLASVQILVDQLAHLVARTRPDVVFCSPEWSSALAATAAPWFPQSTRLIGRIDAPPSMAFPETGTNRLLRALARATLNNADRLVAVSKAIEDDLVTSFGVDAERIVRMNNVVDIGAVAAMRDEPVDEALFDEVPTIVFVGRLDRVKGLEYLLQAVARLSTARTVRCVLVGAGAHEGYLRALTKRLGIESNVHFVGAQANPFRFMSRAAVFVLPSLSEGMPTVLIEAMACGCPVIATDIAGGITRELLDDGQCGLIVPIADAEALAEAIAQIIDGGVLRERLVAAGLERTAEFDLPVIVRENQELIASVVATTGALRARSRPPATTCPDRSTSAAAEMLGEPEDAVHASPEGRGTRHMASFLGAAYGRVGRALRQATRALGLESSQIRRARALAAARAPWKTHLTVLVSGLDDNSVGVGARTLLERLDRSKYEVTLVRVFDEPGARSVPEYVEQFTLEGVWGNSARPVLPDDILSKHGSDANWLLAMASGLDALAGALRTDAVLAHGYYAAMLAGMARMHGISNWLMIAGMHSQADQFAAGTGLTELYGAVLRSYLRSADAVVVPSEHIANDVRTVFGVQGDDVLLIREPLWSRSDDEVAAADVTLPILLDTDARLLVSAVEGKSSAGVDRLIEALAHVRCDADVRLVVFGVELSGLADIARRNGVVEHVVFAEPPHDLRPYIRRAFAYVHAGAEVMLGVPEAIAAAAALGRPIISTRFSTDTSEFLGEGERGLLVARDDARALSDAILQLLWDDAAREQMTARASEYLEPVSTEGFIARYELLLSERLPLGHTAEDDPTGINPVAD